MNTYSPQLKVRLDAASTTLEHLRKDSNLPLELQLSICRTLYEIEQLRLHIDDQARAR
jgi:hypothetical protein